MAINHVTQLDNLLTSGCYIVPSRRIIELRGNYSGNGFYSDSGAIGGIVFRISFGQFLLLFGTMITGGREESFGTVATLN